ncbi:hypothetical protein NPM06_28420, partial [Bacillus cereus]|nr:hypothetical protein [Bacillus cereus]
YYHSSRKTDFFMHSFLDIYEFCNTLKGVKFGRKKVEIDDNFKETYQEWKNHKITAVEAMQRVGMKSNTFYRRVKEYEYSLEKSKLSLICTLCKGHFEKS